MELRKCLYLNGAYGVTFPKRFAKLLGTAPGQYLEVELLDNQTITIRKHVTANERSRYNGRPKQYDNTGEAE